VPGCNSKEHANKIRISVKKWWDNNPITTERRKNNSDAHKGILKSESNMINVASSRYKSWYGNVIYPDDMINSNRKERKYCELWTDDLKERIRAYWGYVSVLSLKEETLMINNKPRSLCCHHVYYQPKACCIWDEDEQGYYANINIGTTKNKNIIKYYIEGDPNKFVTLTAKEHKQIDSNKLEWIKFFEELILNHNGKCYFTKDDIKNIMASAEKREWEVLF
jgi:hypothetical protein